MKKNELTYELICAAVNGEKAALNRILICYDEYINALATIVYKDEQGEKHYYVDEDLKTRIQMKLVKAIPKWKGLKK